MERKILNIICILFFAVYYSQENSCEYISKRLQEKPLECIDKNTLKSSEEYYQIIKWSAFKADYFLAVYKSGINISLKYKRIDKSKINPETNERISHTMETLKEKRLTKKEFASFKTILEKYNFWGNLKYEREPICDDGSGILVYALKKNTLAEMTNGNCAPQEEYLNKLFNDLKILFGL
ncbi:hypothetical protein [Chryseobacterium sp.]|uniref:hypothetical protein n=1 Tax=Chryseobacterium sp. TaxID=1871047 RepID=UPI00289FF2F5|nr:hypothetical protein [Chryseobacterium sp.]